MSRGNDDRDTLTDPAPDRRAPAAASGGALLGHAPTERAPAAGQAPGETGAVTATITGATADRLRLEVAAPASPPQEIQCLPPALLARYELIEPLGRGGMGAVYRARDRHLQRDVALKILFAQGPGGGERLLREARSQARVDHENVCKVFAADVIDGVCHIAMQYIDGAPLHIAAARMTLGEKVRVIREVALALHEAHRLGLVHRDVKPSNVMVEQREDGAYKPYLMDFGIARDAGVRGQTSTDALAGTPQFMAPEQARGETQTLDRRTDVYSLGATLYAVLAGNPPFTASSPWRLLEMIMTEDAPPVRKASPEVPVDLEAIVAQCLEKAPHQRYDSARALADDLQRFLDGDPVRARRLSRAAVLLRRARKHKVAVASLSLAFLAALAVAALWVRERRLAAARAELARELGEDVKEMELFLRSAFEMPLHDIEREKDVVRARLEGIEARMAAMGPAGAGPGHYALGRGYLALQEPEQAREHLVQAGVAGYASPDLDYALGLSLGELYTKALEEAKRLDNAERKRARIEAIEAEYEQPALRHLRASLGARLGAPAYLAGLIALYAGKPEEALAKAREAFAAMPWLYEAKKLEGDACFALGSRFRHDAAFDRERMRIHFDAAAEAYAAAAEIARSDPRVHEAECALWAQRMNAAAESGESLQTSYDRAGAACKRAIAASSRGDRGHLALAFVQVSFAWWMASRAAPGDPESVLKEAVALGEDALRRSPREPMAPYVMAEARRAEARYLLDRGGDARASIEQAIASYEQAIALDPAFLWAVSDLSLTYAMKAESDISRGLDPMPSLDRAIEHSRRAAKIDPSFLNAHAHESIAYLVMAEHLVETGRDPAPALGPWRSAVLAGQALSRDWPWVDYHQSYQAWIEARHALSAGTDAGAPLEQGALRAGAWRKRSPEAVDANLMAGQLGVTMARHLLARGEDPTAVLRDARDALQRCVEAAPWDVSLRVFRARAEIVALRWAAKARTLTEGSFQAARAPLLPLLDQERMDPRLYQALADVCAIEAAWLVERRRSAGKAVDEGLAMAQKALALNPHLAEALSTQGELLLLRAQAALEPRLRTEAARLAGEAFESASRANPLLERELAPRRREASELLGE